MNEHSDSPNYQALADFRFQLRKFLSLSSEAATAAGLDPTQHQLLLVVKGMSPCAVNVGDIAERLMIRHNSAVELISRCERNGWVERLRAETDRRQVHVQLTQNGEAILAELSAVHMRELQSAGPELIRALTEILN